MARVLSFEKFSEVATTNQFLSNGKFQQKAGTLKLGTEIDNNHNKSFSNAVFMVGGAYTQGQLVRSLFDVNDNGSLLYDSTSADNLNIVTTFGNIFSTYPNLTTIPYLYPLSDTWNSENVISNSLEFPIYRNSGKGLGKIEFYNSGPVLSGDPVEGQEDYMSFYKSNHFRGTISIGRPKTLKNPIWPYSGKLYSGHLVQMVTENEDTTQNFSNIKVIPYQTGRGIPQYDPTEPYFGGNSFGTPIWPSTGLPIDPVLSTGVIPGNNNSCFGITVDTNVLETTNTVYKYQIPTGWTKEQLESNPFDKWVLWNKHPAPFTAPPEDISFTRTQRIFSPENSNDNYWAPWPEYYAYQPRDPTPILTRGASPVKIGSAFNIGMQAYYEPDVQDGDDPINNPNYVSVSCVPLFQGEEIPVGGYSYASCLGHVITPEPEGLSPYEPATWIESILQGYSNFAGLSPIFDSIQRRASTENPWYDWHDQTFGATGWTGTPQFLLSGIPDEGTAIISTRDPTNPVSLPYLNQSNQGTLIVHPISTINPATTEGSGRMQLIGPSAYTDPQQGDTCVDEKFARIKKYPGTVERALCVGSNLQKIEGTGRWGYTGNIENFGQTNFTDGFDYSVQTYDTTGGTGSGAVINVTSVDVNGSITGVTINSIGTGYTDGDVLTLVDNSITNYGSGSININKLGTVILDTVTPSVTINTRGSRYKSENGVDGYNLSANNLLIEAVVDQDPGGFVWFIITSVSVSSVTDVSRYPVGTILRLYSNEVPLANQCLVEVLTNDGITITVGIYNWAGTIKAAGGRYAYGTETSVSIYNTQIITQKRGTESKTSSSLMSLSISALDDGTVDTVNILNMGTENKDGDLILINQPGSGLDCIFVLNSSVSNIINFSTNLIKGGAGYYHNEYFIADWGNNDDYLFSNNAQINNPAQIYSGREILIGGTNPGGILNQATTPINVDPAVLSLPTYTGEFGNVQTIVQAIPVSQDITPQPVAGAIPTTGWPTFINRQTATFYQETRLFIREAGTGYTIGNTFATTGGSGTQLTLNILAVDTSGSITDVSVANIGSGYLEYDVVTITGGNGDSEITLKIPYGQELRPYNPIPTGFSNGALALNFNLIILSRGSGYTVGTGFTVTVPDRTIVKTVLMVNIIAVDSNGGITEVEISTHGLIFEYVLTWKFVVDGGNNDSFIELEAPIKSQPLKFTNGGTNYITATGVTTYNISKNSLTPICGLETTGAGECEVIDYAAGDIKPNGWDLTRYTIGDTISFNQDGNETATADILTLNPTTQEITFTQLTVGTGYVQPATSDYGFLLTRNLSETATTVDIIADTNGYVTSATINTIGTNVQYGDFLVIEQVGSDNNVVIQIKGEKNVPAPWQPFENGRSATAAEWNEYKVNLQSAVNLLDNPCLVDLNSHYPNYLNNGWYNYGDPDNKDPNILGGYLKI